MVRTFTSWSALKGALQKEVRSAMTEVVTKSFEDTHRNVDNFYNSPEGIYQRTGQLAESPEMALAGGGDSVTGEIRLNTGFNYDPAGRDTQTIYGYAEDGGLLGNGGFWQQTKEDVQKNITEVFGRKFN